VRVAEWERSETGDCPFEEEEEECLRKSEIEDLDLAIEVNLDFGGFQVPINDALLVGCFEAFANL